VSEWVKATTRSDDNTTTTALLPTKKDEAGIDSKSITKRDDMKEGQASRESKHWKSPKLKLKKTLSPSPSSSRRCLSLCLVYFCNFWDFFFVFCLCSLQPNDVEHHLRDKRCDSDKARLWRRRWDGRRRGGERRRGMAMATGTTATVPKNTRTQKTPPKNNQQNK